MNAHYHSVIHAKKWGGKPEDYAPIDDFIDSSKSALADIRHRAILHNAFGIFICEKVFGHYITNSDGVDVPVRLIAEAHVMQDLGFIPTVEHYLAEMIARPWMSGSRKKDKESPEPQGIDDQAFIKDFIQTFESDYVCDGVIVDDPPTSFRKLYENLVDQGVAGTYRKNLRNK